jgi:hypothetical protein
MYKIKCSGLSPWGAFNFTKEFDTEEAMNSFVSKAFEKQEKSNGLIKITIDKFKSL